MKLNENIYKKGNIIKRSWKESKPDFIIVDKEPYGFGKNNSGRAFDGTVISKGTYRVGMISGFLTQIENVSWHDEISSEKEAFAYMI
ncbi:MAG: hypothetical protein IMZ52_02775 [Actinobacteria bacterium]|nr:hypothetical protein [Actinomycetota bacterium]MBE3114841.1 hypothetical protein [Actinomycetota bacterium]